MVCRWLELVFSPRNQVEQAVSKAIRFLNPYLAFVTYRFHVEKAREIGKPHATSALCTAAQHAIFPPMF